MSTKPLSFLIIGSSKGVGGREHAIGQSLHDSGCEVHFVGGNPGTHLIGKSADVDPANIIEIIAYAKMHSIDITLVGSEALLCEGIVDEFNDAGLAIFGPTRKAAQLEADKIFSSDFNAQYGIAQPQYKVITSMDEAEKFLENPPWDVVVKYPYLAEGKGVIVPETKEETLAAIKEILDGRFGKTDKVLLQERLSGLEVSVLAFADGKTAVALPPAQDHKRIFTGDKGPNTGGMGTYAPVPILMPGSDELKQVMKDLIQPVIEGMKKEGTPFIGVLFAGLMKTEDGFKVLEYNVRPGDPETQSSLQLLSSPLGQIIHACVQGSLNPELVTYREGAAVCVVMASGGYPGSYEKGKIIEGLNSEAVEKHSDLHVFHAGTKADEQGRVVTNGGRVLGVTAYNKNGLVEAMEDAYAVIGSQGIHFEGAQWRTDIGAKGLVKEKV